MTIPVPIPFGEGTAILPPLTRIIIVFLRRLWLPVLAFAAFNIACVLMYMGLEGIRWQDAFFWITHSHSIDHHVVRTVGEQLTRLQIPFVLIETNEGLYRQLLKGEVPVIHGDAKRYDVLQSAGIERARGICIVIDNDADNLYITVTAKALNPKLRIITRAGQERYAQAMRNSGADEVIIPEYEGGILAGRLIGAYAAVASNR